MQVSDLILQLVEIYTQQVISPHIPATNTFAEVYKEKKNFEKKVDELIGQQMDIGIEVIMEEINQALNTHGNPANFDPVELPPNLKPTKVLPHTFRSYRSLVKQRSQFLRTT